MVATPQAKQPSPHMLGDCNTLTATHRSTPQHTATHRNTLQHTDTKMKGLVL